MIHVIFGQPYQCRFSYYQNEIDNLTNKLSRCYDNFARISSDFMSCEKVINNSNCEQYCIERIIKPVCEGMENG